MCLGPHCLEVALTLRNSLFINGILTNMEASYGLKDSEIDQLEQMDEWLLCIFLEVPSSVPREMLYLELGLIPLRYIIMTRRLVFYHYILNEPADSLIHKFYQTQYAKSAKNDWCLTVKANLEMLKINLSEGEIKKLSEYRFKKLVKTAIKDETFRYLNSLKNKHSKVMHIQYGLFKMQEYLLPNKMQSQEAKFAFLSRTRMIPVGANFKAEKSFPKCPYDSQMHLLFCPKLTDPNKICQDSFEYDDLFGKNLQKQVVVTRKLRENLKKRQKLLKTTQN